jgi:hypothetical protein
MPSCKPSRGQARGAAAGRRDRRLIKRAITSVLGGHVLDEQNPFVRDAEGTLGAIAKLS